MRVILLIFTLLIFGCENKIYNIPKTDIVSVYYHENNRFSVGILEGDIVRIQDISPDLCLEKITKIVTDVGPKENMWYVCNIEYTVSSCEIVSGEGCYIHIRSVDSINTAGWNHGKFGSGTTSRID